MKIIAKSYIDQESNSESIKLAIKKFMDGPRYDFINELNNTSLIEECLEVHNNFSHVNHFVQVGIGGSALGPEMLINSLGRTSTQFTFLNNVDPDDTYIKFKRFDYKTILFYVVSKSGGTAETLANFVILTNFLRDNGVSEKDFKNYIVFASDPTTSELRELGNELGIKTLTVPTNVGGRFSALTPVGLLPCLFAGIDIKKLCLSGHEYGVNLHNDQDFLNTTQYILEHYKNGYDQTVLMPYSSRAKELSSWFVQLWAESLGKVDSDGKQVGLTPISSYGATDQHSQMQLFMEGPKNKVMLFIDIEKSSNDYPLKNLFNHSKLKKLSNYTLKNLMDSELNGTLKALDEREIPSITFKIPALDEESIAKLIIFFQYLTTATGYSLGIDPFNQPGVEAGKIYSFEWLDKL